MYRVEDYPQIQGNYFLAGKGAGPSSRLRGDVAILSCFMRRSPNDFSETTRNQYYMEAHKAIAALEKEAKRYGIPLKIKGYHFTIDVPPNANPRDGFNLAKKFFSMDSVVQAQLNYEAHLNMDEAPFLFIFDEDNRSFAWKQSEYTSYVNELSVIFKNRTKFSCDTIVHELLHQFGAADLYFPETIRTCADKYLGPSIMGMQGKKVDDLTAYLIGWKDTISANTYHFLKETMWMTKERYEQAIADEWKRKW